MKKLLLISFLTLGFCTLQLYAMEEREQSTLEVREEETKEHDTFNVKIFCAHDKTLEINNELLETLKQKSITIFHLCEDIANDSLAKIDKIHLPELTLEELQEILILMSTRPQEQTAEYSKFIEQLSQQPLDNLISLLRVANYLDIKSLLDLLSTAIAHKIIQGIHNIPTGNFSKKTLKWFELNKHKLNELPPELLNLIAIQIVEQNHSIKNIILPLQVLTDTDSIRCLAWSPDGTQFISGSDDNTIRVWTFDQDKNTWTSQILNGHTKSVTCLAWSPNSKQFISGSDDKTIRLWTFDQGNHTWTSHSLTGHLNPIRCLAWSPDGTQFISGSNFGGKRFISGPDDGTIRLWIFDKDNNQWSSQSLMGHIKEVGCLAWSPDGKQFISGSYDSTIRVWMKDKNTWNSQKLTGHTDYVWCLAWSPDGTQFISGAWDNTIRVWTFDKNNNQWSFQPLTDHHMHWVSCIAWHPDGTKFISASHDSTIRVWTFNKDKNQWTLHSRNHISFIAYPYLVWNPDGKQFISAGSYLQAWTSDKDKNQWTSELLNGHTKSVNCLAWSPNGGKRFISGSNDNTIRVWTKISYKNFSLEQALVLLIWQQSKIDKTSFEVPQEESLRNAFEDFPDNLKDFLTNKEQ